MTTLYVLLEGTQIRYIGKTKHNNLEEKLKQHINDAISDPDKFRWISNLLKSGKKPGIRAVYTCNDCDAERFEKQFIQDYRYILGLKILKTNIPEYEFEYDENVKTNVA